MRYPPNLPVGEELMRFSIRNMGQLLKNFPAKHFVPDQFSNRYQHNAQLLQVHVDIS
jgi:hypothetical protein